jgi:AsmA protein
MRRTRILLLTTAALAAALALLALGLYWAARLSWTEDRVAAWLTTRLGLPVGLNSLELGYFPRPWVEIGGLAIAAGEAEAAGQIVEGDRIRLVLPWRTLLGRSTALESIEATAPRIHLDIDPSGRASWDLPLERLVKLLGDEPANFSIGTLQIEGGSVDYRDHRTGLLVEVSGLAMTGEDVAPGQPFPMQLRAAVRSKGYVLNADFKGQATLDPDHGVYLANSLAFKGWLGGGDLPLAGVELAALIDSLRADLTGQVIDAKGVAFDGLGVHGDLQGELSAYETAPLAHFKLATRPFAPRTIGFSLNRPLPETADPAALAQASIALSGEWSTAGLQLDEFRGEVDDSRFSGSLAWPAAGQPPQLRLDIDQLDLDRYLPPATPESSKQVSPQAALESLLGQLQALTVDAVISVGVARASGVTARDLQVTLVPDEPAPAGKAP